MFLQRAEGVRPFAGFQAELVQVPNNILNAILDLALLVGIFYAQYKYAITLMR
jgi:hypothetical protein